VRCRGVLAARYFFSAAEHLAMVIDLAWGKRVSIYPTASPALFFSGLKG
jgi:hypothetical protein